MKSKVRVVDLNEQPQNLDAPVLIHEFSRDDWKAREEFRRRGFDPDEIVSSVAAGRLALETTSWQVLEIFQFHCSVTATLAVTVILLFKENGSQYGVFLLGLDNDFGSHRGVDRGMLSCVASRSDLESGYGYRKSFGFDRIERRGDGHTLWKTTESMSGNKNWAIKDVLASKSKQVFPKKNTPQPADSISI